MKNLLARSLLILGALFIMGCNAGGGSSVSPPADVKVVAGDGGATVSWTMQSGVEYWVFSAATTNLTPGNWASQLQPKVIRNAVSPQIVSGLTDGVTYSFTINGRSGGGPGGDGSPSISIVPRVAGTTWAVGAPLASTSLKAVGYVLLTSPGLFVTVGAAGTMFASIDAINWTTVTSGVTTDLNGIVYGGGKFVAVGAGGVIISSVDATTWTALTSPTANDLNAMALGSNGIVAVGANGTIIRSNDGGNSWSTAGTGATTNNLYGVSFVNAQYVAVGAKGTVLTSFDGDSWTVPTTSTTQDLKGATFSLGVGFVVVGAAGTIITSLDGTTWTTVPPVTSNSLNSIALGGVLTAVGDNGTILNSADGVNWDIVASGTTSNLNAVLFALIGYSAVGAGGVNLSSF